MKVVIAPNSFKGSLAAADVAAALKEGLSLSGFSGDIKLAPVGDGGDGTGALLRQYLNAGIIYHEVKDPLGRPIKAPLGWVNDNKTAIIEMADVSGLRLLKPNEYNPSIAHTFGLGQLIKAALDQEARHILLCIGGSATVDGGSGLLKALGIVFKDEENREIKNLPADLQHLHSIDRSGLDKRLHQIPITILCDVKNKLLGTNGAAAVFGPQKGASPQNVLTLEKALTRLNTVVKKQIGTDMSRFVSGGAAGGVAAALQTFPNAQAVDGIEYLLELTGFEKTIEDADWIITGEGAIDHQTLEGKAPYGVAKMALNKNIPVIAVAGKIPDTPDAELNKYFRWILSINQPGIPLEEAIRNTKPNLIAAGKRIGEKIRDNS